MGKRYTLGAQSRPNLHYVLDHGVPTNAHATSDVIDNISDECEICGGWFYNGRFNDGGFFGGVFFDGTYNGGRFYDGWFYGGIYYSSIYQGGDYYGGSWGNIHPYAVANALQHMDEYYPDWRWGA